MPKYTVAIGANVAAYATITVEAENEDLALARAEDLVTWSGIWDQPEMKGVCFEPEFDLMDDFRVVGDPELIEEDE